MLPDERDDINLCEIKHRRDKIWIGYSDLVIKLQFDWLVLADNFLGIRRFRELQAGGKHLDDTSGYRQAA